MYLGIKNLKNAAQCFVCSFRKRHSIYLFDSCFTIRKRSSSIEPIVRFQCTGTRGASATRHGMGFRRAHPLLRRRTIIFLHRHPCIRTSSSLSKILIFSLVITFPLSPLLVLTPVRSIKCSTLLHCRRYTGQTFLSTSEVSTKLFCPELLPPQIFLPPALALFFHDSSLPRTQRKQNATTFSPLPMRILLKMASYPLWGPCGGH